MKSRNKFFEESEQKSSGGKGGCGCSSNGCAEFEEDVEISDTKIKK